MLCLFQVLSTVQQTRVSLALSVIKAALWCSSFFQKFGISKAFKPEAPTLRFHSVWISIWCQCRGFRKSCKSPMLIMKVQQLRILTNHSDKKRSEFLGKILIDNNPSKSIRSIARDMEVFEFLIRLFDISHTRWKGSNFYHGP